MKKEKTLQEVLAKRNVITDGAFGTYYAEKHHTREMPELANTEHPERVKEIYREYIEAGAGLIRTNTFAANTITMQKSFEQVERTISEGIRLAKETVREAAGEKEPVFIAGDIGPIPITGELSAEEIEKEYERILQCFIENGIRILDFETFSDLEPLLPAIEKAKSRQELFVMASFCVNQFGYSASGLSAKRLLHDSAKSGLVDAAGLNCGVGAGHMSKILEGMELPGNLFLMALPNAGYPVLSRNQLTYGNDAEYFALKMKDMAALGVDFLGGCCGTDPGFIRSVKEQEQILEKGQKKLCVKAGEEKPVVRRKGFLYDEKGAVKKKKLIAVELAPPFNANDEKLLESAHILMKSDVDVLTFPDSPSGRTRVDSVLMAEKVRRETGMEVMPHICCRDKNALALRSLFMGEQINEIHNMLLITGDPIPAMERGAVKPVFHFDSVGLMKIAKEMNEEIFGDCPLSYGGAINQGRKNFEVELQRVKKKLEEGAEFFLTQPVFTGEDADRLRQIKKQTGARILCGIMPLVSRKNAVFMKNEIAGVNVTEEIVERYPEKATKEEGEMIGAGLAREVMAMVEDFADGYYFTFPFNRVHLLSKIMEETT